MPTREPTLEELHDASRAQGLEAIRNGRAQLCLACDAVVYNGGTVCANPTNVRLVCPLQLRKTPLGD
jgi:hypothetical protein